VKPKLSVIVSVYNTEKYVRKCIESLINQTYENLELIIIEDGSTDSSLSVLKKYKDNSRVKLIENGQNKGLSYSRNLGLEQATGDYVGFIDSDDYVEKNYYAELMQSIINNKSDLAVCDMKFKFVGENPHELLVSCCTEYPFNKVNVIDCGIAASACNKVFKKDLISKYKFAVGKVNEDIAVVIPAIVNAKKISYTPNNYYYYIQRDNSMQNSRFDDKRFDIIKGVDDTLKRISGCKDYKMISEAIIFNQIIVILTNIVPKEKNFRRRYQILKKYNKLTKKYNFRQNHYYWRFIDLSGKKHKVFFRTLFNVNEKGFYLLSDIMISFYNFMSKIVTPKPVLYDADLNDIVVKAKKQSELKQGKIKISVVVPNYNYARFLYQRIYSILAQDYKIYELIILDDKSKDDSNKVIDKLENTLKPYINIKTVFNDKNSGSAFKQWEKGFDIATGDYVWICEADDYCNEHFLKNVVMPVEEDNQIVISYANTAYIDVLGNIIVKTIIPEIDIQKTDHWANSYVNNGMDEILNYSYLNCTIANVSSTIIKRDDYKEYFKMSGEYHQAGDWLFYVNIMQKGKVAFNQKVLNYYRVHGNNVSSVMDHQKHIDEINRIHDYYKKTFKLNSHHQEMMKKRIKFLKDAWYLK
jgi:glycosyltransferase involved in cell wall biosynthesis